MAGALSTAAGCTKSILLTGGLTADEWGMGKWSNNRSCSGTASLSDMKVSILRAWKNVGVRDRRLLQAVKRSQRRYFAQHHQESRADVIGRHTRIKECAACLVGGYERRAFYASIFSSYPLVISARSYSVYLSSFQYTPHLRRVKDQLPSKVKRRLSSTSISEFPSLEHILDGRGRQQSLGIRVISLDEKTFCRPTTARQKREDCKPRRRQP